MKNNHITDATKILLLAAATIITCIIVAIGISTLNTAKQLSSNAIRQISELNNEIKDSDIMRYDKAPVTGSEVMNCIKKYLGDYKAPEKAPIYIFVKTNQSEMNYTNGDSISCNRDFTHIYYIKPTAIFQAEVIKNTNKVIVGVKFNQQ